MAENQSPIQPRVVEAVGTAVGRSVAGSPKSPGATLAEQAMSDAVLECFAEGITNPEEIKKRKMAAYNRVMGREEE